MNYTYASENESHYHEWGGSFALGFDLSTIVGIYIEYFIIYPHRKNGADANYLNGGFTFSISENMQLDIRGGIRLKNFIDEYFTGTGIIFYFSL